MAGLDTRLISEVEELSQLSGSWRELARACACPIALPGWQLAWWRHLAPAGAKLRAVAVHDGERLVGLAPFFSNSGGRIDFRLLGGEMVRRSSPLALPGYETTVARAVAEALAGSSPAPDLVSLEAVDARSPWPDLLATEWPSRFHPWRYTSSTQAGPVVDTSEGDFESWLSSRSRNFRKQLRVAQERAGALNVKSAFVDSLEACERALIEYRRLHLARWSHRGGSSLTDDSFAMVGEAAQTLFPAGDLRVLTLTAEDERTIAVLLGLAAGGELLLFSYGFDEEFGHISPVHLTVLAAVKDVFRRGERRIDFGGGDERQKLSFANADAPLTWTGLVIRSRRYPLTRARLVRAQSGWLARRLAQRLLSPRQRQSVKRLLRR